MKRAMQRYFLDEIAMAMLDGKIDDGQTIVVDVEGDKLIIK
ncbi:hypothetical protein KA405_00080 [Patescibacteria group bacterium]|nr:hypothetical protein [Patescibacteria group bacterium]